MSTQHVTRREFENWRDDMTGYVETALDKYVRASERRVMAEIQRTGNELRKEFTTKIEEVRDELKAEIKAEVGALRTELVGKIEAAQDEFRTENRANRRDLVDMRAEMRHMQEMMSMIMVHLGIDPPKR